MTAAILAVDGGNSKTDVALVPYYRIAHERYSIYWTLTPP